jgi:RimJ/RimL family protein N-acetyltransferase
MSTVPTLTDGVIVLDGYLTADLEAHLKGEDEEQARRFGWFPARSTRETVTAALADWQHDWETDGDRRTFALRLVAGRELAGGCEVRRVDDQVAEVSYWIFPAFRARGLAARAVRLVADWAGPGLGVAGLRLSIAPDNEASLRVAHAVGFTPVGERNEDGRAMLLFERPLAPDR